MYQNPLFTAPSNQSGINLLSKDGSAFYYPEFLGAIESARLMKQLQDLLQWDADRLMMFGKPVITRRKVAWVGDPTCTYTYSGVKKQPQAWIPELLALKSRLETLTQSEFNSCLLNLYHDGADGMGWHSDDEKELDAQSPIASLSLGASRKFVFRHKQDRSITALILENGSALIMQAPTQKHWQHALLKSKNIHLPRINLTFRKIILHEQ